MNVANSRNPGRFRRGRAARLRGRHHPWTRDGDLPDVRRVLAASDPGGLVRRVDHYGFEASWAILSKPRYVLPLSVLDGEGVVSWDDSDKFAVYVFEHVLGRVGGGTR